MRSLPTFLPLLVALVATLSLGCNMTRLAANSTVDVFAKAAPTFEKESDIELAKASGLGNIKMVEGLIEVVPDNVVLLELTSKSFGAYAFGFLEPQLDSMDSLSDEYEALALRAVNFYNRGKDYASRALELEYPGFRAAMDGPADQYEAFIQQVEPDWVSILFWVGYNWGAGINLQLEDPGAVVDLPKVMATMERVVQLDETTYFGNAHTVLAVGKAALPKALGGDPDGAKAHFERARSIVDGRYLMTDYLYARFYHARANPNQEAFESMLNGIIDADEDLFPEQQLANEIAKERAAYWLERSDELF